MVPCTVLQLRINLGAHAYQVGTVSLIYHCKYPRTLVNGNVSPGKGFRPLFMLCSAWDVHGEMNTQIPMLALDRSDGLK